MKFQNNNKTKAKTPIEPGVDLYMGAPYISRNTVYPRVLVLNKRSLEVLRRFSGRIERLFLVAYQFIDATGTKTNNLFREVAAGGGFNKYYRISTPAVLDLIMADELCRYLSPKLVTKLLKGLKITLCTTFDDRTYLHQPEDSKNSLMRISRKNKQLLKLNPDVTFIGIVKGCNPLQISQHAQELLRLGITELLFHVGDYLACGSQEELRAALEFAHIIRDVAPVLTLHGIGTKDMLRKFAFADAIVTYNHVIEPRNGIFTDDDSIPRQSRRYNRYQCPLGSWGFKEGNTRLMKIPFDMDAAVASTYLRICDDWKKCQNSYYLQAELSDFASRTENMRIRPEGICLPLSLSSAVNESKFSAITSRGY